jgi:peptide/nickel transport system permease protein
MLAYTLKRILWAVVLLWVVSVFTFVVFFVVPSRGALLGRTASAESVAQNSRVHFQPNLRQQYVRFLNDLHHGSLGRSWRERQSVGFELRHAIPVTATLVGGGLVLWLAIALTAGILSALRPRSLLDRGVMVFVLLGASLHPIWIGSLLVYVFGYRLHVAPVGGYCGIAETTAECGGPMRWAWHMLLPWLTFALLYAALYTRMIRASVLDALGEDYVRTARAKGCSMPRVLFSHVLRNALLPLVTLVGMDAGIAFGGSIFVERVFGLPGLGQLAYRSLNTLDLPVILGVVLVVTVAIVLFNLAVDLAYTWLDPRIGLTRSIGEDEAVARPRRSERKTAVAST